MKTNQTPSINPDLDAFLSLYFDPEHTPPSIAKSLGVPLLALSAFMAQAFVQAAIAQVAAIFAPRAQHIACAGLELTLSKYSELAKQPFDPSPLGKDRHRRILDSTRRAAEMLFKFASPIPVPARKAKLGEPFQPNPPIPPQDSLPFSLADLAALAAPSSPSSRPSPSHSFSPATSSSPPAAALLARAGVVPA
jgi:hypothetical protein